MKTVNLLQREYLFGADGAIQEKRNMVAVMGSIAKFVCFSSSITLEIVLRRIASVSPVVGSTLMNDFYYRVSDVKTGRLVTQSGCVNKGSGVQWWNI